MSQPSRLFLGALLRCWRGRAQVEILHDIQYLVFDKHKGEVMRPRTEILMHQKWSLLEDPRRRFGEHLEKLYCDCWNVEKLRSRSAAVPEMAPSIASYLSPGVDSPRPYNLQNRQSLCRGHLGEHFARSPPSSSPRSARLHVGWFCHQPA